MANPQQNPPDQMMHLINQNLTLLVQNMQAPPRKATVEKFESTDPIEWAEWRLQFQTATEVNGWNDQRARRELFLSMTGEARHQVRHIPMAAAGPNVGPSGRNATIV